MAVDAWRITCNLTFQRALAEWYQRNFVRAVEGGPNCDLYEEYVEGCLDLARVAELPLSTVMLWHKWAEEELSGRNRRQQA